MSTDLWLYSLGTALGEESVSAQALVDEFGPVREDFLSKTGFETLYRASSNQTGLDLAVAAIGNVPGDWWRDAVDTLVYVTSTGDLVAPGNGHLLQQRLGLSHHLTIFDVNDACTGFVKSLQMASSLIAAGAASTVLLVLSDTYSKLYDPSDLRVSPLFSDGASALLLSSSPLEGATIRPRHWRVLASNFISEGSGAPELKISREVEGRPYGELLMNGGGVLSFVLKHLRGTLSALSEKSGETAESIDAWYVHQGSRTVVGAVEKAVGAEAGSLFRAGTYGNTVGSSLPFQLQEEPNAAGEPRLIGLLAFGVGLTMAGMFVQQISES